MLKGFRDFIARGNVIDLAVAVVIGAAFTAVVTAIVDGLISPLIGWLLSGVGNLDSLEYTVPGLEVSFKYGLVVNALISFLAIAAVVYFVFVLPMNKLKERQEARAKAAAAAAGVPEDETPPSETELLIQIRDLLAKGTEQAHEGKHSE